jgi:hypothetical protein
MSLEDVTVTNDDDDAPTPLTYTGYVHSYTGDHASVIVRLDDTSVVTGLLNQKVLVVAEPKEAHYVRVHPSQRNRWEVVSVEDGEAVAKCKSRDKADRVCAALNGVKEDAKENIPQITWGFKPPR